MCNNESHNGLNQPEHFTRHSMRVEQLRNMAKSGLRAVSLDDLVSEASEALSLADPGVPKECVSILAKLAAGDIQHATAS